MKKIIISRTDAIGDLMLITPLIKELKQGVPGASVSVLAGCYAKDVLLNNPDVEEVIEFSGKKELAPEIKKRAFDISICVYPDFRAAMLFKKSGVPERVGTAYRWFSFLAFNKMVKMHRKHSEMHEADYNLMLARHLIGERKASHLYYYMTEEEEQKGLEYVRSKGIRGDFICVQPWSGGSSWNASEKKYSETGAAAAEAGFSVIFTAGGSERAGLGNIRDYAGQKQGLYYMDEDLSIRELAAVIKHSSAFISSSTGPMHIAAALGVRTLTFFPPDRVKAVRWERWKPVGNDCAAIKPGENSKSEKDFEKMPVQEIIAKLKELIA